MALENYGTIWVCGDCLHHHANGECGTCHNEGHKRAEMPLKLIRKPFSVAMGMGWDEHNDECIRYVVTDLTDRFPDMVWPDVPDDYECDCEESSFSTSQCEGCGSYLYGERHAMTLFKGN